MKASTIGSSRRHRALEFADVAIASHRADDQADQGGEYPSEQDDQADAVGELGDEWDPAATEAVAIRAPRSLGK